MIKEVENTGRLESIYTIECDHCGKNLMENNGLYGFDNTEEIEIEAEYNGWIEIDGKHTCTDCLQLDGMDECGIPESVKNAEAEERHDYETACR